MPIYEFRCQECGKKFTVLVRMSEREKVKCPACESKNITQVISACSFKVGGSSGGSCGSSSGSTGFG